MNDVALPAATVEPGPRRSNPEILSCVEQTEKLDAFVPKAIVIGLTGLAVIGPILSGRFGAALLNGLIIYFVARGLAGLVNAIILNPLRATRYRSAAGNLARQVQSVPQRVTLWRSWWIGAPGAISVTENGNVIIVDRSTDYEELWLTPSQIANVSIEREATQITNIKHGGSFTLGGVSGGLFGGYTFGSRSRATTTTIEKAFLEIRYQFERNGAVYTTVLPFESDRRAAEELCATLTRLEHSPA